MSRPDIHYWKCDRPEAFHGTGERSALPEAQVDEEAARLSAELRRFFGARRVEVSPSPSQGIHRTWRARIDGEAAFVRIDDSGDGEGRLEMESAVLGEIARTGVPVPRVLGFDASRSWVPFAWQALECFSEPDLNRWFREGTLAAEPVAFGIGRSVARWQSLEPAGFGPFDLAAWRRGGGLAGFHRTYADYFRLRLGDHLGFLVAGGFLTSTQAGEVVGAVEEHAGLLERERGVLVHKDLALWNVLGAPDRVVAFIDFDDAISGDPLDDLSLLACFHDGPFLERALAGYESVRPLPEDWRPRFWLHLLRNLVVKAVIRLGAGYFRRDAGFFLIGPGGSGADLRAFTERRLATALAGLRWNSGPEIL